MAFLPSALRRLQETGPAGYVVALITPGGNLGRLTNADLMDLEDAEAEAASWRRHSSRTGLISGDRVVVCAVVPVEQVAR